MELEPKHIKRITGISLCIFLLTSCAFLGFQQQPEWLWETPMAFKNIVYAVGGPSETLQKARVIALQKVSAQINTQVSSIKSDYSAVTYNAIKREIDEQSQSWVESKSNSIIIGIQENERWYESSTDKWWVLISINKDDLQKSIKATADELIRKKRQIEINSIIAANVLNSLGNEKDSANLAEQLAILSDAYRLISKLEFKYELIGEVQGHDQLLLPYVESLIQRYVSSLQLTINPEFPMLYKNIPIEVMLIASSEDFDQLGSFSWTISTDNAESVVSLQTGRSGSGKLSLLGSLFPLGSSILSVTPDFQSMGYSFVKDFKIPIFIFPVNTFKGKGGVEVILADEVMYSLFDNTLLDFIGQQTNFLFENRGDLYPLLTINVEQKEGTSNDEIKVFHTAVSFHCQLPDSSKKVFQTEFMKGFGGTAIQAKEVSFRNLMKNLEKDKRFITYLEECFDE